MSAVDQSRRRRPRPSFGRGGLLLASLLAGLVGCETGMRQGGDPMMGIHSQPTPVTVGGSGETTGQTAAVGPPPLPASLSAPSPAAIASGTTTTPEEPRALRIADAPVTPTGLTSGAARGVAPANVTLETPQPATTDNTARLMPRAATGGTPSAPLTAVSASSITTFEAAQRYLKQCGVTWQRLDLADGQWSFQCSIPNRTQPSINRNFVTDRPFPDELSAIRAVIDQIDKDGR